MTALFLTLEEALALHSDQIARYGGIHGVRDLGLLSSALAAPSSTFDGAFLHPTLIEMAAAYLFHLVKNHPFLDGNKRTGLAAALVFLELHELRVEAPDDELTDLVLGVAEGRVTKAEVRSYLATHLAP